MKLLEVSQLCAGYGDVEVLKNINLHVNEGEIVAIFGSNGSGKSTFLKVVAGLLKPWSGSIRFKGKSIEDIPTQERVRRGIALAGEGRNLFLGMSVKENLILGGWLKRNKVKKNLERVYKYFPQLRDKHRSLAGELSGGQQQMLSIGRALMSEPQLLMIDELSFGLAPVVVKEFAKTLEEIRQREGIAILLVEQEVSLALKISDRAYVFDLGEIVDEGRSQELVKRDSIKKTYLNIT